MVADIFSRPCPLPNYFSAATALMTQWQKYSVFWQQASHVEIYIVLNTTNYFSVLMIEYLVATAYVLWMM